MRTRRLFNILTNTSTVFMLVFLYLFVSRNAPGLTQLYAVSALAVVYGFFYLAATARFLGALEASPALSAGNWPARVVLLLCSALLVYVFLDAVVTDYYQPLSLYDEVIGLLALWWILLIVQNLVALFAPASVSRPAAVMALMALASWPLAAVLWWINVPQPGDQVAATTPVFIGGENGYDIYRIPGLTLIPAGSLLANGQQRESDRLLAFAEARRDGSLDTGVIDLVMKTSDDNGLTWSEQVVLCRHQRADKRGKCGNPTPLFDSESGKLVLAYNLSGLETNTLHHSGHIVSSDDGGASWGDAVLLSTDNFVFGPGKGMRKARPPREGRLLLPGYVNGSAALYYSDDHGRNWSRGEVLAGGNESDVAELADGQLYLATRHIAPISRAPEPNGRLYSISSDGGSSWPDASLDKALQTPVCQVSVLQAADGGLLFSNPAHHESRVAMTIRYSADKGATWPVDVLVYPGPAGYSVLAQGSGGDIYVLYENGHMAYSERISLARLAADKLLPSSSTEN